MRGLFGKRHKPIFCHAGNVFYPDGSHSHLGTSFFTTHQTVYLRSANFTICKLNSTTEIYVDFLKDTEEEINAI